MNEKTYLRVFTQKEIVENNYKQNLSLHIVFFKKLHNFNDPKMLVRRSEIIFQETTAKVRIEGIVINIFRCEVK